FTPLGSRWACSWWWCCCWWRALLSIWPEAVASFPWSSIEQAPRRAPARARRGFHARPHRPRRSVRRGRFAWVHPGDTRAKEDAPQSWRHGDRNGGEKIDAVFFAPSAGRGLAAQGEGDGDEQELL